MSELRDGDSETFPGRARKILLIGTLGAGKTTVALDLAKKTGYPYTSIDECRIQYSDSTVHGEDSAWWHFLAACADPAPGILEFSGGGPHVCEVREALLDSGLPVAIIWLDLSLDTCIKRASLRQNNVPAPFPWGPIDTSARAIYSGIEGAWNTLWCAEPRFHATRMRFRGNTPYPEMYARVVTALFTSVVGGSPHLKETTGPASALEAGMVFAEERRQIRGLVLFGSYARKEQTALSDLDLVLLLEEGCCADEMLQDLLTSLAQKPWAVLHPETNKWILFFEEGIQKIDLFIVHDVKEIERYLRGPRIQSAADSILVDKDGQFQTLFAAEAINTGHSNLSELTNVAVEKFLDCFDHAVYYARKDDPYLFYFNYTIAIFHIAELMQIELGDDSYLYSPRNLLSRISPVRKEQLSMLSTGIPLDDEIVCLRQISESFLDVYQQISRQQIGLQRSNASLETFFKKQLSYPDMRSLDENDEC